MLIGKKFGRYEIRSKIGAGGMGEVYAGFDTELNRQVAVKILPAEFSSDESRKNRFRQEALAVSALNHPNIITIYEIGENEFGSYLVTELIDGSTLREIIKREPLSLARTLKIIEQVANALVAAHRRHIVHRDIKPENIMLRRDGYVKILDFGLAKPIVSENDDEDADGSIKTIPGMVMGSARYMSPEQTRGIRVDERTDIWSLGVVLYEMVTGNAPFKGATTSDTIAAVIYREPEPLFNAVADAPAELQRIVRKALQKDRDERYQNVKDLAIDIKNLLYDLEHLNSGEQRMRVVSRDFDITENPTMIHQTASANHPTRDAAAAAAAISTSYGIRNSPEAKKTARLTFAAASLAVIAIAAIAGFGFYRWLGGATAESNRNGSAATTTTGGSAFEKTQVTRLNTDGKIAAPTISPDGKYVAYLSGDTGNRSLVVRQISTDSTVTIIPPTALNLFAPVFSPEGDYVYYLLSSENSVINTLYRVPTLGGAPKKLIEDVDSAVTFSPDGKQIAFQRNVSREAVTVIFTANIDGTNVQPLLSSAQTEFNIIASPKWSPDGTRILVRAFNNFGGVVEKTGIAEISPAEKKFRVLNPPELYSVYELCWLKDSSGFLFIGQETPDAPVQVFRADAPPSTGGGNHDGGKFYPVTNDTNNYSSLGLSSDGKTIVTLKSNFSSAIWNFNPATKQLRQITAESANLEGSNGLSPLSGGRLLHTRKNGNGGAAIWMMDVADPVGSARQISTEVKSVFNNPKLTADGRYIVFSSKQSGTARIWRMDAADGRNLIQLTREKPNYGDFNPQLTPDGKTVIYQEYASGANGESALLKVSIEGGESSTLYHDPQYNVYNHTISPDGKHIAFDSYRKSDFDKKVRVASLEPGGAVVGQTVKEFSADSINSYIWSPDGESLTFLSNRSGAPNLWRLPLDGSTASPQPITDFKSGRIFNYAWSAGEKSIFIVRGNVNSDLILIRETAAASHPSAAK